MVDKKAKLEELKKQAVELKKEVDYYNALQLALKLVLNGSYGAFATQYFILFNEHVAGTITAQGRELTKLMRTVNNDYWFNKWHDDFELHHKLGIKNIQQIQNNKKVSIYADTDSLFVSFEPAINHCDWKDQLFQKVDTHDKDFIIISHPENPINTSNTCCQGIYEFDTLKIEEGGTDELKLMVESGCEVWIDGYYIKDWDFVDILNNSKNIRWNWHRELDFIHGIDKFRYAQYFKDCLTDYANSFGVDNREDFELERVSESIINIAKKKYIQHIVYEDGIPYERLKYIFPKGVELVRSSTPAFAREKIVEIVKYLFTHPDDFNIKNLLALVKNLRREFELSDIDDVCMQSSVSNYEQKVLEDKDKLDFISGTHFAVKAAAYYNHLLYKNKDLQSKYEFIKSGTKIKYYHCKNKRVNKMFAYMRGSHPIEFAPEVDYDEQFMKSILSPINSIIEPLGMPEITKRLTVVLDIFGGF